MMMCPAVLAMMVKLKLPGMRAAHDEVLTPAAKRHHWPERSRARCWPPSSPTWTVGPRPIAWATPTSSR